MNARHSSRSAGCLYMFGFLSGLAFIALCGSSAAYNGRSSTQLENRLPVAVDEKALPNTVVALETTPQVIEDIYIGYGRSELGDEFIVRALGIDPGTFATVRLQDAERLLVSKVVTADQNSMIEAVFDPLTVTLSLAQVDIYIDGEKQGHRIYPLPVGLVVEEPSTTPKSVPAASATTTSREPTAPPPPPPVTVTPTPTAIPTPSPTPVPIESFYPNWRAEYYDNTTWGSTPSIVRDDPQINFDWGENSPAPGAVGQNWFSIRWTRHLVLPEGYYHFILSADDQAEVYIDGQKILSYMGKSSFGNQVSRYIKGQAPIDIVVEYIEYWGNAHAHFYWEQDEDQGCCWNTTYYKGTTAFNEPASTEVLPGNNLSVSWDSSKNPLWTGPFSAQISRELQAPNQAGDYHLCAYTHDTIRVWLDRNLLIDHQGYEERTCLLCRRAYLGSNPPHHLSLEYTHALGEPFLGFLMTPAKAGEPWVGAFFNNSAMHGPPVAMRTAAEIDFDWQDAAPTDAGVSYDNFAVRWQRPLNLIYGQYRFHVRVDDGVRLRIDGQTLIDEWNVGAAREYSATYDVRTASETAQVELDYYENTGKAVVKLWWDAPPPTPTPTPTNTPSP